MEYFYIEKAVTCLYNVIRLDLDTINCRSHGGYLGLPERLTVVYP